VNMSSPRAIRGVVLAGGSGQRLRPLTLTINKHLLPVGSKPMIYYPIERLVEAGVTEIAVVTGVEHIGDIVSHLRSGARFGCSFTYFVQDEPLGIAHALSLTRHFAAGDPVLVVLGDNIFFSPLRPQIDAYFAAGRGARVLLKEVEDPRRFGVARFEGERLVEVQEKPDAPPSDLAVTGIYFYDAAVYDILPSLTPSGRGEYEIADVNNAYIAADQLSWGILDGPWSDAGTHPSLARAQRMVQLQEEGE
jgi:glucose-1-phosphate thymidylyltransferase